MEGPKVPSEARRCEAPRGCGLGRGAVAPPQYGGLKIFFQKINVEIAYFSALLQAKMHRRLSDFYRATQSARS